MIVLPYLTAYQVTGADASGFLHAQLAADTAALATGESCHAAYCNPRGQVIGLMLAQRHDDGWLIAGQSELMHAMVQRLQRFVLRAQVDFTPESTSLAGVAHDRNGVISPRGSKLRYALATGPVASEADVGAWKLQELRSGVVWLAPATTERFIPQMLGLERIGAVSFRKGCYPGQEIIARTRYLGKVKRLPSWLSLAMNAPPPPGTECVLISGSDRNEGIVVDSAPDADGHWLVLAVAPLDEAATVDWVEIGDDRYPAERLFIPAIRR